MAKKELRSDCMGTLHAQNIPCDLFKVAKQLEVILNPGLGKRAVIAGEERPRLRFGIRRHNQPLRMRVPNSGLEILYFPIPDAVNGVAHALVLCAHFAPDAQQRASEDGAALFLQFGQTVVHIIEVAIKPFERRSCWRKKSIHVRLVFVPFCLQCSDSEF